MILVFLVVLVIALILANFLISASKPIKESEKGFLNPSYEEYPPLEPPVITDLSEIKENHAVVKGAVVANNKKIELLNERIATLENVVLELTKQKLDSANKGQGL